MNSLTDRDVIDKISEACEAGVDVQMTIRGIACIKAGVPGKTDGLEVRQIVGRFLEHARIYSFGADADMIYLSSADMMTRNTERRVEIAYPVFDPACREIVKHFMALQHDDNVKARRLDENGEWQRVPVAEGEAAVNSQETLLAEAYERARVAAEPARAPRTRASEHPDEQVETSAHEAAQKPTPQKAAPAPVHAPAASPADARKPELAAPRKKPTGRISRGLGLIGAGIRTLFSGK